MNKYMLLLFDREDSFNEMSPEDMQNEIGEHMKWIENLGDHYDSGEALLQEAKSITGKEKLVTDGPYIESKELLGGFYIISANSMEEAAELAKNCPTLELGGSIEIREVMKM
ncbi:MAG: YciI family protein [Balneola sp.]